MRAGGVPPSTSTTARTSDGYIEGAQRMVTGLLCSGSKAAVAEPGFIGTK